jgi:hypothetical protein
MSVVSIHIMLIYMCSKLNEHILVSLLIFMISSSVISSVGFCYCMYTVGVGGYVVLLLNVSLIHIQVHLSSWLLVSREYWVCVILLLHGGLGVLGSCLCTSTWFLFVWCVTFFYCLFYDFFGSIALCCYWLLWICYLVWSYLIHIPLCKYHYCFPLSAFVMMSLFVGRHGGSVHTLRHYHVTPVGCRSTVT